MVFRIRERFEELVQAGCEDILGGNRPVFALLRGEKDLTMIKCMDVYFLITKRMHGLHTTFERLSKTDTMPILRGKVAHTYDELGYLRDELPCKPSRE